MKATSFHPTGDTTVMAKAKPSDRSRPLTEEGRQDFVDRFLAELMQMTGSPDKQEDFQAA